jgi:negative regulator of flagellin synthesis FlgM
MSTISHLNEQVRLRAARAAAALRSSAAAAGVTMPAAVERKPDALTLSDQARSIVTATKLVIDAPDVRDDRVTALKKAIAAGTYSIDSRRLASKLLSHFGI